MDELPALRLCLLDSLCVGACVGGFAGIVGFGRRLWVASDWPKAKRRPLRIAAYCSFGSLLTSVIGFSLIVAGDEWWTGHLKGIAALVLLGSAVFDYSSDSFARLMRGFLMEIVRACLTAALKALNTMTTPNEPNVAKFPDELSDEPSEDLR